VSILLSIGITWERRCDLTIIVSAIPGNVRVQGDIHIDQAHRGYDVTHDETGKAWINPF